MSNFFQKLYVALALAPLLIFSNFLKILGLKVQLFLGTLLGELLQLVHFRRKIVESNLALAFAQKLKPHELADLRRRVYHNIGIVFLGIARNFSLSASQIQKELRLSAADRQKIQKILSDGKGAVFISAHISNWELFAMGMAVHGFPVEIVVKKMNNRISQALIERLRFRTGLGVLYSGGTLEKMRVSLAKGKAIGFMVDQNTTGKKAIRVNFYGVPASSIRGLAGLVRETGTKVVPICAYRLPCGNHEVKVMNELPYLSADHLPQKSAERIAREEWLNTAQYQSAIEKLIDLHPEQWLWIHRRWKARRDALVEGSEHMENLS